MKGIALTAEHQAVLDSFLWEALWDPPSGPRRGKEVLLNPHVRAYVDDWASRPDDLGFALKTESGEILGVVWSRLLLPPYSGGAFYDERTPQLGIAVAEAHRGKGLGSELMSLYINAARERFPGVSLGVHPENPARKLYERFGFEIFAEGGGGYLNLLLRFTK
jgi:ribosomal protein S18 acetylase RimI-like enzyme